MTEAARQADVIVVGAGLAGLAATVALSGVGAEVTLLDRKPYIGGRAYSYPHPALEEEIDSQHILLGCCTNLIDLCRLAGAEGKLRWYDRITLLEPATAGRGTRASAIGPQLLPAPLHSTFSFLRARMLSPLDKLAVARGLMDFMRGYPASDAEPFSAWLARTGQTERAIRHFWEPTVLAALNDGFERSSTRYIGKVMHEMLLRNPDGVRFGIPTEPLSTFLASFLELAQRQGAGVRLRTGAERLERADGRWRVHLAEGGTLEAAQVVLALPFEQTAKLLQTLPDSPPVRAVCENLRHFVHAPITTIHLWLDRTVTELPHAGLLDTRIQWMFNKTSIRTGGRQSTEGVGQYANGSGQYLELTISASFAELKQSREEILAFARRELALFFPRVREAKVLKSGVLKEARATFSVVPGLDRFRPASDALGDGLLLAGDWTRTGWPSTMEGAVRSGRLAAEAAMGEGSRFLSPDLPATGLMRLLV